MRCYFLRSPWILSSVQRRMNQVGRVYLSFSSNRHAWRTQYRLPGLLKVEHRFWNQHISSSSSSPCDHFPQLLGFSKSFSTRVTSFLVPDQTMRLLGEFLSLCEELLWSFWGNDASLVSSSCALLSPSWPPSLSFSRIARLRHLLLAIEEWSFDAWNRECANYWNSRLLKGGPLSVFTTSGIPNSENTLSTLGITVLAEVELTVSTTRYLE